MPRRKTYKILAKKTDFYALLVDEDVKLKIENEPDSPNKLRLNLNGMNILDWFREKYQEVQQKLNIDRKPEMNKSEGIKFG